MSNDTSVLPSREMAPKWLESEGKPTYAPESN